MLALFHFQYTLNRLRGSSVSPPPRWCRGVVVSTTAQLHSTKSELMFCAGSNPACGVSVSISGNGPGWK